MRRSDGENGFSAFDIPLSKLSLYNFRNLLKHGCSSLLLKVIEIRFQSRIARVILTAIDELEETVPDGIIESLIFHLP